MFDFPGPGDTFRMFALFPPGSARCRKSVLDGNLQISLGFLSSAFSLKFYRMSTWLTIGAGSTVKYSCVWIMITGCFCLFRWQADQPRAQVICRDHHRRFCRTWFPAFGRHR